jgi:hypothetical protein
MNNYGYLKLYGENVKLLELSIIGSFGAYKYISESVSSLHLNYEHDTIIIQFSQFLTKILALIGPI